MVGYTYDEGSNTGGGTGANLGSLPGLFGSSATGLGGLGAEGAGLGLSLFGAMGQAQTAKQESAISMQKAGLEMQQNQVRWNQAQMGIRNANLQELRNAQQSRSLALTNAVGAGTTTGSSNLGGAYGNIGGEEGTTLSNLSNAYQFGQQQFNINNQLSGLSMQEAQLQEKKAHQSIFSSLGTGLSSLGGSLIGASTGGSGGAASLLSLLAL